MSTASHSVAHALNLRAGEGRPLAVLAGHLLLCTATTTILSATKNGLFLSVYPASLIPHVVIGAALLTALAAIVFSGMIAGTARRSIAIRLNVTLVTVVLASRWAFQIDPRAALGVYLAISVVQVLLLIHAWDFAGDVLTGRQAKRLTPLIGVCASVGALVGGASVPAAALGLGTENLLLVGAVLLATSLPILWGLPEPAPSALDSADPTGPALRAFASNAARGFRKIASEPLLRLSAFALVGITITGTLVELQFKVGLQETYDRDRITAVMGIMSGVVGIGTILVQILAARWIFPKLGVSFAAALHGGALAFASVGSAVSGSLFALAALAVLDDTLQFSIQKPVEQVSLLPFPGHVKRASVATLNGVMRPLAKAAAGLIAILFLSRGRLVPIITAAAAGAAFLMLIRHRKTYLSTLAHALEKHSVEFTPARDIVLVADRESLSVIDQALEDRDPEVVVFALSLLEQLPPEVAIHRAAGLLAHPVAEARAAAADVLGHLDLSREARPLAQILDRLGTETSAYVVAHLLTTLGDWGEADGSRWEPFLDHDDPAVRREALIALGRSGWPDTEQKLRALLGSGEGADRAVAAAAVGALQRVDLVAELAGAIEDDHARPAVLEALSALGAPAVPVFTELLGRRELPLPLRRSIVTALAEIDHPDARTTLLDLADEPGLGPPALTSLQRLRREAGLDAVDPTRLRATLRGEVRRGFRCALAAAALRTPTSGEREAFIADELGGLSMRSVYRVMRILTLSHDPHRIESVQEALGGGDAALRSSALELLEGTLSAEESRLVVPFVEASVEGFPHERLIALMSDQEAVLNAPLEALLGESDWWARALALHGLGRDHEITVPGRDPGDSEKATMIPLIERVMILKGSQLFRYLPGGDLAGIASLAEVMHLETDAVVFEQGDVGEAFYMVVRGSVRIMRGSQELAVLGPREGFGEMAILDQETRSATATAAETTTLLRIDRDAFDRLVEQNPSVARGIYRVLTRRLRNTLAQVAAG